MSRVTIPSYVSFSLMALQHSISIADAKAGYILAGSIALLTFSIKEITSTSDIPLVAKAVVVLFVASAGFAAATFRPRLSKAPDRSISYWKSEIYRAKAEEVLDELTSEAFDGRVDELVARHLHALAAVCRRKYGAVNMAFYIFLLAICGFFYWTYVGR
jgi:hypothetical protein